MAQNRDHVSKGRVPESQRKLLRVIGDRLEKPGKERQTITGTLQRYSAGQVISTSQVSVILETPGLLRLEDAGTQDVIVFNGTQTLKKGGQPSKQDTDLVESLAIDTVEGFVLSQLNGARIRLNGEGFRVARSVPPQTWAIYEWNGPVRARTASERNVKTFGFDTLTHILQSVIYRQGPATVETRFSAWRKIGDQTVPGRVTRLENNVPTFSLTLDTVAFSTSLPDGLLQRP